MLITTTPLTRSLAFVQNLADTTAIVKDAESLLDDASSLWQETRTFHYPIEVDNEKRKLAVETFVNKNFRNDHWNKRSTTIRGKENTFEQLNKYFIGSTSAAELDEKSHVAYEQQYIGDLKGFKLKLVDARAATEDGAPETITYLAQLFYHFLFPIKGRVFNNLIHVVKNARTADNVTSSYVIQIPVDAPSFWEPAELDGSAGLVPAQYLSVERIQQSTAADGSEAVKWDMSTSANPGGLIPLWLARFGLDKVIANDVPMVLDFLKKKKQ